MGADNRGRWEAEEAERRTERHRAELAKVCDDIADVRAGSSPFDDGFRMGARTCAAALLGSPMRPKTDACDECRFVGEHSDHCSKSTR